MMEVEDYTRAMNCNFCGGAEYECEEILKFIREKKRTIGQIEKFVEDQRAEAVKVRKSLISEKKVIKKVTFLH